MASAAGVMFEYNKNSKVISGHRKSAAHAKIVQKLQDRTLEEEFEEIRKCTESANNAAMQVTVRMMRTVYMEVQDNVPFHRHDMIVQMQKLNDAKPGIHQTDHRSEIRMVI